MTAPPETNNWSQYRGTVTASSGPGDREAARRRHPTPRVCPVAEFALSPVKPASWGSGIRYGHRFIEVVRFVR